MAHRLEEGLLGEMSESEALDVFKSIATSKDAANIDWHTDVDRDGILGERFYHKF
tara:strand:- start:920 stop:1084 length:165 start_codon:yes stop_codon:yes gene_type:complete